MTTVISRAYANSATAPQIVAKLHDAGFPADTVSVFDAGAADVAAAMEAARVPADAAASYAGMLSAAQGSDGAAANVVVVRAPFTPFGAAKAAMDIVDTEYSIAGQNHYIEEVPKAELFTEGSILKNHPLFATSLLEIQRATSGRISDGFGWKLLSKKKTSRSAISGGKQILPFGTLKSKSTSSAISGGRRMLYNPDHL